MTGIERRRHPRYPAIENRAVLAWQSERTYEEAPARLEDVSLSGARLVAAKLPAVTSPVWVRLQEPATTTWVEAAVVPDSRSLWSKVIGKRRGEVRLKFRSQCPYDFFKLATHGTRLDVPLGGEGSPEFDSGVWR